MFDDHVISVLYETTKIIFPVNIEPNDYIKRHAWRDRKYVGEVNGRVSTWQGWSANLTHVDFRYRAVFIDLVENNLPYEDRVKLFGLDFAQATENYKRFVILFVLDFPIDTAKIIKSEGFVPRYMTKVVHACQICSEEEFLSMSASHWAAKLSRLILLQRVLSIHRKPFDAKEVPLQNLLYRTGYLHSYLVNGGLELQHLSKPRKAGEEGHDLHATVRNPVLSSGTFSLGIEVYMGSIGYHVSSIPSYANKFQLSGIIVVSKDDPWIALQKVKMQFIRPIVNVKLSEMGQNQFIGIHHLPFEKIIMDFEKFRNELDEIVPNLPTYFE